MPTDITEKGLETLIMRHMTGTDGVFADGVSPVMDRPDGIAAEKATGSGWQAGRRAVLPPMTKRIASTFHSSSLSSKPLSRTLWLS